MNPWWWWAAFIAAIVVPLAGLAYLAVVAAEEFSRYIHDHDRRP